MERGARRPRASAPYRLNLDVPMPIFRTPWGPTEHMIAMLVHHERGMSPGLWLEHAEAIRTYLDSRLDPEEAPLYVVEIPEPEEDHERDDDRSPAGDGAAA